MYSKTAQRLNKLSYQNVLNLFLQLLNNILYFSFRKLIVYYKYYILTKKFFFEKKSEFKCDRILKISQILECVIYRPEFEFAITSSFFMVEYSNFTRSKKRMYFL